MARHKLTDEEKKAIEAEKHKRAIISSMAGDLRDKRYTVETGCIGEPTIFYEVGQRVQFGHVEKAIITEVLDGGKILKLATNYLHNNYGTLVPMEGELYVFWNDVSPYKTQEEIDETPSFHIPDALVERVRFSQRDIAGLLSVVNHFGCDFDVDYQRGLVWTMEQKVALIESIFNHIPIGTFIFNRRPFKHLDKGYEIIDGKQRLTTIVDFCDSRFTYKGILFRDMHPGDCSHFERYPVSYAEIEEADHAKKMHIFLKFNTCGKAQDPEHLEKVRKMLEAEKHVGN